MAYTISHPKLELEIKIEEIEKLYPHEETIPEIVNWLVDEIKGGTFKHPVIVDKETLVVLDGMHRLAALQLLGCKLIPVCLVDYDSRNIILESWFRTIIPGEKREKAESVQNVRKQLEALRYNLKKIAINPIDRKTSEREIVFEMVTATDCYGIVKEVRSLKKAYEYLKELERRLRLMGYKLGYETEDTALCQVKSAEVLAAIVSPRLTKRDVVATALSGEVFVHKSTRHVIPARPLFVNVPTEWLNANPHKANEWLLDNLSKKKVRRLPPGQKLDRLYEEELYVFSDI